MSKTPDNQVPFPSRGTGFPRSLTGPKHRYIIFNTMAEGIDALCRRLEDEGCEILGATIQPMPMMAPGGQMAMQLMGFATARLPRDHAPIPLELEAKAQTESRIVTLGDKGPQKL